MKPYFLTAAAFLGLYASEPGARAQVQANFAYSGKLDNFTAPIAGTYRILAFGAQGGNGTPPVSAGSGGLGAEIGGDIDLTDGETLTIAVGGAGSSGAAATAGSGGGGSFVVGPNDTPLIIAGGGGGGGVAAVPVAPGTLHGGGGGVGPDGGSVFSNKGGTNGSGGSSTGGGGGGGGFLGAGSGFGGAGGGAFPELTGGTGTGGGGAGGFGGGGGAGSSIAGGGGGYSGGAAPPPFGFEGHPGAGGGGSFDASTNPILIGGVQAGNGHIMITLVSPTFAGTPGAADCHGKSVSTLAQQFGGLSAAATAVGFANVVALQTAISAFCQK
jgi:hypothetical protein